jgi:hypothetical protein
VWRKRLSAVQVKYVISATSFGSTQWTRDRTIGEPKRVLRGGEALRGEHLDRHPCAHATAVYELAAVGIVAEQQRPEIRPRHFRVGPADDDELLAAERLGLAPEAAISGA